MIEVTGTATLIVNFSVDLDMTEDEFDSLPDKVQKELLDGRIDWMDVCRSAEVDEIEVDDITETEE